VSGHNAMTNLTIIDTDILIDTSRNKSEAIDYLQNLQTSSNLAISAVTQMELIVGCTNKMNIQTY
jgi:predicted nucleic acid-binding protein